MSQVRVLSRLLMDKDADIQTDVGDGLKAVTGKTFSGSFTIKGDSTDQDVQDLKEYLEDALANITVTTGRGMGRSRMYARRGFGESVISRMKNDYLDLGDHRVIEETSDDGIEFTCDDCDWKAVLSTDNWSDEEVAGLKLYIYGEALDTPCVQDTSGVETTDIAGVPVVTTDKEPIGVVKDATVDDDKLVGTVGVDPARRS